MTDLTGAAQAGFVPGRHSIEAYGRGGFRFAGMSHRGSVVALPSGIRAWPVSAGRDIRSRDLDLIFAEPEPIEFLLVGTGPDLVLLRPDIRARFREASISLDAMATGAAARTYNVLLAENRRVGAALVAVS